eukprot:5419152-Amphidinium_carterae.1
MALLILDLCRAFLLQSHPDALQDQCPCENRFVQKQPKVPCLGPMQHGFQKDLQPILSSCSKALEALNRIKIQCPAGCNT